jgi:hypothetical protein
MQEGDPSVVLDRKPAIWDSEIEPVGDARQFDGRGVSICIGPEVLEHGIRISDGELLVFKGESLVFSKSDVVDRRKRSL